MAVMVFPSGGGTVDFSQHMSVLVENGLSDGEYLSMVTKGFFGVVCFLTSVEDKLVITPMFNPKKIKNELNNALVFKKDEIEFAKISFSGKLIFNLKVGKKQKFGTPSMYEIPLERTYAILRKLEIPTK